MNVSMYKNSSDNEGVDVDHKKVLKAIEQGRYREDIQNLRLLLQNGEAERYAESKRSLPSVTFAGTFHKRAMDSLKEYSGIVVIDIDKLNESQLKSYRAAFASDPYIYSFFISPGGEGLKVLVKVDSPPEKHLNAFLELEEYFKSTYAIAVDKSGKDISRLCYVSYDPEIYINENPVTVHIEYKVIVTTTPRFDERPESFKGHVISKDAGYIFKICEKWTQRHHEYVPGDRNNYIHILACNLNRAGVDVRDSMMLIFNNYSDLPFKEIEKTVQSGYKNRREHNSVDVYNLEGEPPEETDMTVEEETIYNDTLLLLEAGVKNNVIAKLIKTFGIASLSMDEEHVSRIMNEAVKASKESGADSLETITAEDALIQAARSYKNMGNVSTLVPEFDDMLSGGLSPGQLYEFIGMGGSFKSLYAQCIGCKCAKDDIPTLYLNGEMGAVQLLDRLVNKELHINLIAGLRSGEITEENIPVISEQLKEKLKGNFFIVSSTGWTYETIMSTKRSIEKKIGRRVGLVIADGLTQMEDTKKDEIRSAIFNSGELKKVANDGETVVIAIIHTNSDPLKHTRDTSKYVRGGTKVTNNADAMMCTSMLIDADSSNMDDGDILYKQNMFYLRLIDKRGSGLTLSKIMQVHRPMELKPLDIEPSVMEVKI